jgi:hypothetical protein
MASTTSTGVGTQMTSLPACPDFGSKDSFAAAGEPSDELFCACAAGGRGNKTAAKASASAGLTNLEAEVGNDIMLILLYRMLMKARRVHPETRCVPGTRAQDGMMHDQTRTGIGDEE